MTDQMHIQAGSYTALVDTRYAEAAMLAGPWHTILMRRGTYAVHTGHKRDGYPTTYLGRFVADLAGMPAGQVVFRNGDGMDCRAENLEVLPGRSGSRAPRNRVPWQPQGVTRHKLGTSRPARAYHVAVGGVIQGVAVRAAAGRWDAWRALEPGQGHPDVSGDWRTVVLGLTTERISSCDYSRTAESAVAA